MFWVVMFWVLSAFGGVGRGSRRRLGYAPDVLVARSLTVGQRIPSAIRGAFSVLAWCKDEMFAKMYFVIVVVEVNSTPRLHGRC